MSAVLLWLVSVFASLHPALAALPTLDEGDDQYQFIVGLCEKGMFDLAEKEAAKFVAEHPDHPRADAANYRRATALFELRRAAEAEPLFRRLIDRPGFEFAAEATFRLGQIHLDQDQFDAAIGDFDRVLAAKKDYLKNPATFLAGEALFRKGDYAAAEKRYRASLAAEPDGKNAKDARYGLAWCAFRTGRFDDCVAACDEFRAKHAGDPLEAEIRLLTGEAHLEAKRPKEALAAYRGVPDGPFLDAALRGQGFAYAAQDDHANAAKSFRTLLDRVPDSRFAEEATLQLGIHLLQAGQAKDAVAALESKAMSANPEALYWRARAKKAAGDKEGALADLQRATSGPIRPDLAERMMVARGDLLFEMGKTAEAAEAYGASGSDYALHAAAVAKFNAGEHADAEKLASTLLQQHEDSQFRAETELLIGECRLAAKDAAGAEQRFEAAARDSKDESAKTRALERLAWSRFLAGRFEPAAVGFADVLERRPDGVLREEAGWMLAKSLDSAGKGEDAAAAWSSYLDREKDGAHRADALLALAKLDPGDGGTRRLEELVAKFPDHAAAPSALYELSERHAKGGRKDDADRCRRMLIEKFPSSPAAPAARYQLAFSAFEQGRADEAAAAARALADAKDTTPELRLGALELLAFTAKKTGDVALAQDAFARLRAARPDDAKLWNVGRIVLEVMKKAGKSDDAAKLLADVDRQAQDPGVKNAVAVERVFLALDQKDVDGARELIAKRLASGAPDAAAAEAAFFVGEALFEAKDDAHAAPLYDVAARTEGSPVADRALYKSGFCRLRAQDWEHAEPFFATLAEKHEKSPLFGEALFLCGECRYRLGKFADAMAPLDRLRKEQPKHDVMSKALFRLGLAACQCDRWQDGAAALDELKRRFPKFENGAEAALWRGRALAKNGNARAARAAFDETIASDKGVLAARARLEIGRLHFAAGSTEDALAEFMKVAVLYAAEDEVTEGLFNAGQCLEKIGDVDRARAQYTEIVNKHPRSQFAALAKDRLAKTASF